MPGRLTMHLLYGLLAAAAAFTSPVASGAELPVEETAVVVIQGRQFKPDRTILHQGIKTKLVFENRDSELHAVVPFGLFTGESLSISGNGAPEFGPEGFKRIVIPPEGIAEIRFTPTKPGEHRYLCDMPGHEMSAVLVVE